MSLTYVSEAVRRLVIVRAGNRCEYCLCPDAYSAFTFHIDHIIPESLGGATEESNLAYSCGCNGFKSVAVDGQDPLTGDLVPLFHPRTDRWSDHFAWREDGLEIVGKTATGRATLDKLQMNRRGLIGLRRLMMAQGEHPPPDSTDA
jgi:5-methylcytosine-specific restriction endonuclease McrA